MSILKFKKPDGTWESVAAIKGEPGKDGAIQYQAGEGINISEDNVISVINETNDFFTMKLPNGSFIPGGYTVPQGEYEKISTIINKVKNNTVGFIIHVCSNNTNYGADVMFFFNIDVTTKPTKLTGKGGSMGNNGYSNTIPYYGNVLFTIKGTWEEDVFVVTSASITSSGSHFSLLTSRTALSKTNTDSFTPTSNYHPATKKYVDDNKSQVNTLPEASANNLGKILQYTGETTEELANGYFYQVISETTTDDAGTETTTYSWSPVEVQSGGEELFHCIKFEHRYSHYIFNKYNTPNNVEYITTEQGQMFADYINKYIQGTSPFKTSKPLALDVDSNLIFTTSHGNGYNSSGAHTFTFTFATPVQGETSGGTSDKSKLKLKFTTFDIYLKYENGVYSAVDDFKSYFTSKMYEDYLALNNTKSYTPTGDYNPATKKYVDDAITTAITSVLEADY